jgi:hypothetical protein
MRIREPQKKKKEKFLMFGKRLRDEISLPVHSPTSTSLSFKYNI